MGGGGSLCLPIAFPLEFMKWLDILGRSVSLSAMLSNIAVRLWCPMMARKHGIFIATKSFQSTVMGQFEAHLQGRDRILRVVASGFLTGQAATSSGRSSGAAKARGSGLSTFFTWAAEISFSHIAHGTFPQQTSH